MNLENNESIKVKSKSILGTILKGGFGIVLPTFGMIAVIFLIYDFSLTLVSPITWFLEKKLSFPVWFVDILSLSAFLLLCFACGLLIKTKVGVWFFEYYERVLKKLGVFKIFKAIKEIYEQLTSDNMEAFKEFAICYPFGRDNAAVPAFIIEKYKNSENNMYVVFAPTVPNPTSGFSYHLKSELVDAKPDIPVEKAFRMILSCGVGSVDLLNLKEMEIKKEDEK
tara:strand:- start:742 stop:1413 length:672 start_codon:yes stop_codon:yes gene_type:complete